MATVAPSFTDLLALGQAEAQFRRSALIFAEGDMTVADLHAAAAMADAVLRTGAQWFRETFLDGARGAALAALVNDHMNIQRSPASSAEVTLEFTRTGGGAGGTIPLGTTVTSQPDAAGKRVAFTTDAAIVVGAGLDGPFAVAATCQESGPDGNVVAGSLTILGATLFDTSFTVNNPATAGGGNDAESDESLRERSRSFWTTLRRGTLDALEYGAKTVPTVKIATASEGGGMVTVMVTDEDGNSTAEMVSDVIIALEEWRGAGPILQVLGGTRLEVELALRLVVRRGFSVAAVESSLIDSVVSRADKLKVGESLYLDMIVGAVVSQYPDDILDVQFETVTAGGVVQNDGLDPIAPALGQVIRVTAVTIQAVP